jgi:hypothetical protein
MGYGRAGAGPTLLNMDPVTALAPILRFDAAEPFLPQQVAATAVSVPTPSPSFPGSLEPWGDVVVEYALWWDREIGHVYELEHVWVHGRRTSGGWDVIAVEGSAHGGSRLFSDVETVGGRPVVYCEPGKHGTADRPEQFALPRDIIEWLCGPGAGRAGVCVTPLFEGILTPTPSDHRRARRLLSGYAFEPTWEFTCPVDVRDLSTSNWAELQSSIPGRVFSQLDGIDGRPLLRSCGPIGSGSDTAHVVFTWGGAKWLADGCAIDMFLEAARAHRQEIVALVEGDVSEAAASELVQHLRRNVCFSATSLITSGGSSAGFRAHGVTVVEDRRAYAPRDGDDWVAVTDPARHRELRTVGPGGDIDTDLAWVK